MCFVLQLHIQRDKSSTSPVQHQGLIKPWIKKMHYAAFNSNCNNILASHEHLKKLGFGLHMFRYTVQQDNTALHGHISRHTKSNESTKAISLQRCNKMYYIKLELLM